MEEKTRNHNPVYTLDELRKNTYYNSGKFVDYDDYKDLGNELDYYKMNLDVALGQVKKCIKEIDDLKASLIKRRLEDG